jgi:hypothetical protein
MTAIQQVTRSAPPSGRVMREKTIPGSVGHQIHDEGWGDLDRGILIVGPFARMEFGSLRFDPMGSIRPAFIKSEPSDWDPTACSAYLFVKAVI